MFFKLLNHLFLLLSKEYSEAGYKQQLGQF